MEGSCASLHLIAASQMCQICSFCITSHCFAKRSCRVPSWNYEIQGTEQHQSVAVWLRDLSFVSPSFLSDSLSKVFQVLGTAKVEHSLEKPLVPGINWEKCRLHKLSSPQQNSLHTLGTCLLHQNGLCRPGLYVLHFPQHLWEDLMQKLPAMHFITLHAAAAAASKQRHATYIPVLRKKGRGGYQLTLCTGQMPLSVSLLSCGRSCAAQVVLEEEWQTA